MNTFVIIFWILLGILIICFFRYLAYVSPDSEKNNIYKSTEDAILIAVIIVMSFVPQFGYITIVPGLSLTLLHLPVLIGAYRGGWKKGILYGLTFGITSWIVAIEQPLGLNAFFVFPWISVLSRILFGFFAGLLFAFIKKKNKLYRNGLLIGIVSFFLSILHTCLVFADLFIFYPQEMINFFKTSSSIGSGIVMGMVVILIIGSLGEATLASIFTPLVTRTLAKITKE